MKEAAMASLKPIVLVALLIMGSVYAGATSRAIEEAVELVAKKSGTTVRKETIEMLSKLSVRYGEKETIQAFKIAGHDLLPILAKSGDDGLKIIKMINRYGEPSLYIIAESRRVGLAIKCGDQAAVAMIKHKGIAEDVIEQYGPSAAGALNNLDPQNARRLSSLASNGSLGQLSPDGKNSLFSILTTYGNAAMEKLWNDQKRMLLAPALSKLNAEYAPKPGVTTDSHMTPESNYDYKVLIGVFAGGLVAVLLAFRRWLRQRKSTDTRVESTP